jgi:hypothetical protein
VNITMDSFTLDQEQIREAIEGAEPPRGTIAWAERILSQYEPKVNGPGSDILKVYEMPYVEAAAILSIDDASRFERLKKILKDRGVKVPNWERRVRERERAIKKECEAEQKAQQQKDGGTAAAPAGPPAWTPLVSVCQQLVDGYVLFRDICNAIKKFVTLSDDYVIVVAIWILFSWVFEKCAETNPYLRAISPLPNCGKSTLLKVLRYLTRGGWLIARATMSSFVRKMQRTRVTLLLDEADSYLQENEEMRNVLDAGNDPDTATVSLSEKSGDTWVSTDIDVFVPIVIASIKKLRRMETVESRSITVWLQRATKAERRILTKARRRDLKAMLEPIADRCARWAQDNVGQLAAMPPPSIDLEDGRDSDKWEPLVKIADYLDAGRLGPRLRQIAAKMTSGTDDQQPWAVMLLADVRYLFDCKRGQKPSNDPNADKYWSKSLCEELAEFEDRPWPAMGKSGKPINQNGLARMLRDFQIVPHKVRIDETTLNGFYRKDFEEAWARYPEPSGSPLPDTVDEDTNTGTSATEKEPSPDPNRPVQLFSSHMDGPTEWNNGTTIGAVRESGDFQGGTEPSCSTLENGFNPLGENSCASVPVENADHVDEKKCVRSPTPVPVLSEDIEDIPFDVNASPDEGEHEKW